MTGLLALTFAGTVAAAWAGTGFIVPWLARRGLVDRPNERSSHALPTPRGGGIAPVAVTLAAWLALAGSTGLGRQVALMAAGAILLLAVGWIDDRRGLSRGLRLAAQAAAVAVGLAALPSVPVLQGLVPAMFDRVIAGLIWLWFLNLYNFMDGIDGLAGGETIALGLGTVLAVLVLGQPTSVVPHAVALSGAAAGFLRWNWPPARVFLGDSGSVALAYLAGWLLLALAASGAWAAALILPLYFLADATSTLAFRIVRGEPFWRPHREHAYQIAVGSGRSHAWVTTRVLLLDLWLVALAVVCLAGGLWTWLTLAVALVSVGATLCYFRRARPHAR